MAEATASEQELAELRDPRIRRAKEAGQGDSGREMIEHVAQGATLNDEEERDALDWLLGARRAVVHEVPVDYETPVGMVKLTFVLRPMDGRRIDEIERRHISPVTGQMDRLSADVEIVAEATEAIRSASGRETRVKSEEFLTVQRRGQRGQVEPFKHAAPPMALEERFKDQLGLLQGVALEVRRVGGFTTERVGTAQRKLVKASLG